jgi:HEXXH motif-containing protein
VSGSTDHSLLGAIVDSDDQDAVASFLFHRVSWSDFGRMARGQFDVGIVSRLRAAERSRRLLLLRALVDAVGKEPELAGPLPSPEVAWELLSRVEARSPATFDLVVAYPYTGSWAGYTIRLLRRRIAGVCPLWMHIGHLHALAVAAAIRSGLDFDAAVPVWEGATILPSLGTVRLNTDKVWSVAHVHGRSLRYIVSNEFGQVSIPEIVSSDAPGWWGIRGAVAESAAHRLEVRLDDLDPYRGLYEPIPPQRLVPEEIGKWRLLLDGAWKMLLDWQPDSIDSIGAALDALVPTPKVPFRNPSASTGEAFGSAVLARSSDAAALAATLVHEFRHMILGGILHLVPLYTEDTQERFYVPWRDDPRPLSKALQGLYAFAGVVDFWRMLAHTHDQSLTLRAEFEFAYWRGNTIRVLDAVCEDQGLTEAGQRFLDGMGSILRACQDESVSTDAAHWAAVAAADHYAGWRIRHLRPDERDVAVLADAWIRGYRRPPSLRVTPDPVATPVPDGQWSSARADLIRIRCGGVDGDTPPSERSVPNATFADIVYMSGQCVEAAHSYQSELAHDPDSAAAWVGLGLALATTAGAASRALLRHPELVRAVYRQIRSLQLKYPAPAELATWIGQIVN